MVMAYDFNWSGSARAGASRRSTAHTCSTPRGHGRTTWLVAPASKLIWGVPYYGRAWTTDRASGLNSRDLPERRHAARRPAGHSGYVDAAGRRGPRRRWDAVGRVPWYRLRQPTYDTWVQGYYDDWQSLNVKYDLVKAQRPARHRHLAPADGWHRAPSSGAAWRASSSRPAVQRHHRLRLPRRHHLARRRGITSGCGVDAILPDGTVDSRADGQLPGPGPRPARQRRRTASPMTRQPVHEARHQSGRRGRASRSGCEPSRLLPADAGDPRPDGELPGACARTCRATEHRLLQRRRRDDARGRINRIAAAGITAAARRPLSARCEPSPASRWPPSCIARSS